jgi:hypothetical protein
MWFVLYQFKYGCRVGFSRRESIKRAVRIYLKGF